MHVYKDFFMDIEEDASDYRLNIKLDVVDVK